MRPGGGCGANRLCTGRPAEPCSLYGPRAEQLLGVSEMCVIQALPASACAGVGRRTLLNLVVLVVIGRVSQACAAHGFSPASTQHQVRGVAQSGSAPGSGPGGRRFESSRPDHLKSMTCSDFRSGENCHCRRFCSCDCLQDQQADSPTRLQSGFSEE
jgi:hypothetical protein